MTALRPEREDAYGTAPYASYGGERYGADPYGGAPYGGDAQGGDAYGGAAPGDTAYNGAAPGGAVYGSTAYGDGSYGGHVGQVRQQPRGGEAYAPPPADDETVALRLPEPPPAPYGGTPRSASDARTGSAADGTADGGRAARRRAAKGRRGRHGGVSSAAHDPLDPNAPGGGSSAPGGRPLSRVEARRRQRARKPSPAVVASRAVGEVFITTGVLMLLFVTYQLWWTNVRAHAQASAEADSLQDDWASGKGNPGTFSPGQGFAILHIPKLDVVVPIAEGVSNKKVLDKGMVGHYGEEELKTAMPQDKTGNFGLAGHRNTHGEPFRYINRLSAGDAIVVETQDEYFVYKMASILPVTSPSNTSVLDAVPAGSGFTKPGRYITLTTCTPEFTSKYRMIVWGKMVEERPRSKGKPDALVQ
ncbi:class E sortase [Streptomyces sp. Amel2xC10]|uniref:class E sortase n=1 Tax=Streptomyces sp. Amel2xC10 TaxID=1305826 RepID=UPI000A08F349|nr:class E sortase [Streptomyces sp. Amel2xC10]SMF63045.1 sortase A [Streptomyces sp. Amel2xC10]